MRVTVVQTAPDTDKRGNIARTMSLIDAAVSEDRPDLVILPEVWNSLGGTRETKFANAEPLAGPDGRRRPQSVVPQPPSAWWPEPAWMPLHGR